MEKLENLIYAWENRVTTDSFSKKEMEEIIDELIVLVNELKKKKDIGA